MEKGSYAPVCAVMRRLSRSQRQTCDDASLCASKDTGKEVWCSAKLTRNANEGIDMAPGVFDGTVYISTVPGNATSFYKGNGAGVLWAFDADTGKAKWKFWTVPENLWSTAHTDINSGGGLWKRSFRRQRRRLHRRGEHGTLARHEQVPMGLEPARAERAHEHAPQAEPRGRQDHLGAASTPARRLRLGSAATADPGEGRQPRHRARRGQTGLRLCDRRGQRQHCVEEAGRHPQRP